MNTKYGWLIGVAVGVVLGVLVGYFLRGTSGIQAVSGVDRGGQASQNDCAQKLAKVQKLFPPIVMKSISGSVKDVNDTKLVLRSADVAGPLEDALPAEREVIIGKDTAVVRVTQKNMSVFQNEMEDFQKEMQKKINSGTSTSSGPAPMPYTETAIKITDVKQGDFVEVLSDNNIRAAKSFTATKIQVK